MKRFILSLAILVMATSLTAQVSVWDGSYEEFDASNGKGLTEDNPILIENAAQLAFMSQLPYSANNKMYYKLTTDIDLNYLPWTAIGLLGNSTFCGYFDGGNHSISKLEFALFSYAQGYIKNLTITDTDFVFEDVADNPFGSVTFGAYYDEVLVIENCHSYANITVKDGFNFAIGGIVGECRENTYIYNCSNHGDINVTQEDGLYPVVGGIGGLVFNKYDNYYKKDVEPFVNDGYPIIDTEKIPAFDIGGTIGVEESVTETNIEIYPNPARDFIKLSAVSGQGL